MMSATKNEMHSSRSLIKLKNRLVENSRIARKPNVAGFENRFRKATYAKAEPAIARAAAGATTTSIPPINRQTFVSSCHPCQYR